MKKVSPKSIRFPRPERRHTSGIGWGFTIIQGNTQSVRPIDPFLTRKLGMQKNDKVLVFAGFSGEWARALAKNTKVTFTDITPESVAKARVKSSALIKAVTFSGNVSIAKVIAGERAIQRPKAYDWSFSFEPIPMRFQNTLKLAAMRSLLNKKGMKVVYGPILTFKESAHLKDFDAIARIYGAEKPTLQTRRIIAKEALPTQPTKCYIITLKTNDAARAKAWLDVRVWKRLARLEKEGRHLDISDASKQFNTSEKDIVRSLRRLQALDDIRQR